MLAEIVIINFGAAYNALISWVQNKMEYRSLFEPRERLKALKRQIPEKHEITI
jgi:hypothetical protein